MLYSVIAMSTREYTRQARQQHGRPYGVVKGRVVYFDKPQGKRDTWARNMYAAFVLALMLLALCGCVCVGIL